MVPRNRASGGLHAWGNVVPSCRECNRKKGGTPWRDYLTAVARDPEERHRRCAAISDLIQAYGYEPDARTLLPVLAALYKMADQQARGLVAFALAAAAPQLGALDAGSAVGEAPGPDDLPTP